MEHLLDALLTVFIPAAAVTLAAALYCLLMPGGTPCERKPRRTLVEEDQGFLDPDYVYYAWHGPLVRGLEPLELGLEYGERLP